ncbi:MAG: cbb3-type cytochrome c oxidase subunit I [Acidimicrobiia bacterium]
MTDTLTGEKRTLLGGGAEEDRVAAAHLLTGAAFLTLGGALALLSLIALRFPDLLPLSYGRLEAMANLTLLVGFGVISLVGGIYYVLPRLTGARLWSSDLARLGLASLAALVLAGLLALLLGLGSGRQPLGLPWWLDLALTFILVLPLAITVGTVANRAEEHTYVTLWFVLGGAVWLPLIQLVNFAGDLPFLSSVAVAYTDVFVSAGFVTLFLFTVGTGLLYYTTVKELDVPLASRQLAIVGFWSLGFAAVWWGAAQLIFGPGPGWVAGVAAALGLAFPVGALANAANITLTLEGSWSRLEGRPGVLAGLMGLYLGVAIAVLASLGAFRSVAAVVSLTSFWEAVEYVSLNGVGPLLVAGTALSALPRLVGRELYPPRRARTFTRLTIIGSVAVLFFLAAAGVLSGYSWIGGSNSGAYIDAGEGWGAGVGASVEALLLLAVISGFVLFAGQLAYASTILGTFTRGPAIPQEVLVSEEAEDE